MSSLNLVRWGSIGFVLAGVVRLVLGFLVVGTLIAGTLAVGPGPILVLLIVVLLLTAVGLVGLHVLQRESYGRIGRAGFYTILVAVAARILLAVLVLLSGSEALVWLLEVGAWGMFVGFVLYGAATVQARVLPRWYGVLLIVFEPFAIVFGSAGNIWEGLALLVLGYALWSRRDASAEQPSRVR